MLIDLTNYLVAIILGIMFFFSFAVAPITFKVLDETNARNFIRTIFPNYYLINLFLSVLAIGILSYKKIFNIDFYLISLVAILFAISNCILMPMINTFRDAKKEKEFQFYHTASVVINIIQIIILIFFLF